MTPSSTNSRPACLPAWLRALVVVLLVALAVPAVAMADEGTTGTTTTADPTATSTTAQDPAATSTEPAATTEEPPRAPDAQDTTVATDPAPAAEDSRVPVAEAPVAEPPPPPAQEPQAPPAASDPAPTVPPASSGGGTRIDIPVPVIDLPEIEVPPLPTIPEVLPGEPPVPAGEIVAPIPALGELVPVLVAPEAPKPPSVGALPAEPPRTAGPTGAAAASATVAAQAAAGVLNPDTLGGPPILQGADPISLASRSAVGGTEALAAASVPLRGSLISLDPSHAAAPNGPVGPAGGPDRAGSTGFGAGDAAAPIAAPRVVAPGGPAPAQSILAVLASYILPGSGPVPAGTIFLLVMLGVVLAAAFGPRPGGSERIWLSGLLGPRAGHALAVRRPG